MLQKHFGLFFSGRQCTYHHHHHHMVFLEWPKQQRYHEDHYTQRKYEQYRTVLSQQRNKYVFKWRRKVDRDGAEVTSSGKLFRTLVPAIGKTRLPTVGRRKDGTYALCMCICVSYRACKLFNIHLYATLCFNYFR